MRKNRRPEGCITGRVEGENMVARVSARMTVGKVADIVHQVVIKDRIQRFYALAAHEKSALVKFKRSHGYCGGSPSCMEYTGDEQLCRACKTAQSNPKYKKKQWEYGKLRAKDRERERAEREEKNEKERKSAPKRKAA